MTQKEFTPIDQVRLDIFLKKNKRNKNDNVQNIKLGELTAADYPYAFECYKRRLCEQHLFVIYAIMSSIQIQ